MAAGSFIEGAVNRTGSAPEGGVRTEVDPEPHEIDPGPTEATAEAK